MDPTPRFLSLSTVLSDDLPVRGHVVRRQLPFFLSVLVMYGTILFLHTGVLHEERVHAALAVNMVLLALCALTPWERLPPASSLVVPVLDVLPAGLLWAGVDSDLIVVVGVMIFPVLWLAVSGRMPRSAVPLGGLLTLGVMWAGHRASGAPTTTEFRTELVLIPVMMLGIGYTVQSITVRLARQEAQLRRLLAEGARRERLLDTILATVDVGVVALGTDGHLSLMNREQRRVHELALPEDLSEGLEADLLIYADAEGTPLPVPDRPGERALRGETFSGQLVWVGRRPNQRVLSASAHPMRDEHGRTEGAVLSLNDVTELVAALQAKDDFLAGVSHELRTPLTSIRGYTELLAMDRGLSEDVRSGLEVIERNSGQLLTLVDDLLGTTADVADLQCASADLVQIVHQSVAAAEVRAAEAGVDLHVDAPPRLELECDPVRIGQVLDNLLSNAIKYSPEGGPVTVRATRVADGVRCDVVDRGAGLSGEDAENVFDRFFRSRRARESSVSGLGLGLTIAQKIVEEHGGEIRCDSVLGQGTVFTVTLPVTGAHVGPQGSSEAEPHRGTARPGAAVR